MCLFIMKMSLGPSAYMGNYADVLSVSIWAGPWDKMSTSGNFGGVRYSLRRISREWKSWYELWPRRTGNNHAHAPTKKSAKNLAVLSSFLHNQMPKRMLPLKKKCSLVFSSQTPLFARGRRIVRLLPSDLVFASIVALTAPTGPPPRLNTDRRRSLSLSPPSRICCAAASSSANRLRGSAL
jgi:hypothetical protein